MCQELFHVKRKAQFFLHASIWCLFESALTIWCSSLLEDARVILSVEDLHLAVCTSFETLCFACLYKSLKIANLVFIHFLSSWRLTLLATKSSSLIDSNHGEVLWFVTFRREGGECICSTMRTMSQYWLTFSTDENSETLESSAINYERSMLAMHLTVLDKVEGLETGINAIIVWFVWVCNSRFSMDVIVRSNTKPVNDMTAHMSGLIDDLDMDMLTKSSQSLFG